MKKIAVSSCLFRLDAGKKWGLGHFRRCLPLAMEMQTRGFSVTFVMVEIPGALREIGKSCRLNMVEFPSVVEPGSLEDLAVFKECRLGGRGGFDWMVFDGYNYNRSYRESVGSLADRILIIQDVPGDYTDADLFLDQNVNTSLDEYRFNPECRTLIGPKYSLTVGVSELRSSRVDKHDPKKRVLITLGGADVKRFTFQVVKALEKLDVHFDIVLGSESGWHPNDFANLNGAMTIHEAPDGLDLLMASADIGIMSLGITTWEMCFYGLPFVMLASNPNQGRVIDWFRQQGLADDGLKKGEFSAEYLRRCVNSLLRDDVLRSRRSTELMKIVDGKGPERIVDAMLEL